jgi:hypothetical protein
MMRSAVKEVMGRAFARPTFKWSLFVLGLVIAGTTVAVAFVGWVAKFDTAGDRLGGLTVTVAAGTFLLAAGAAGLALIALGQSLRNPVLSANAMLRSQHNAGGAPVDNAFIKAKYPGSASPPKEAGAGASLLQPFTIQINVHNSGDATARNVVALVELRGPVGVPSVSDPRWAVLEKKPNDSWMSLLWDGGLDWGVHPGASRLSTELPFSASWLPVADTEPSVFIRVQADGAKPAIDAIQPTVYKF